VLLLGACAVLAWATGRHRLLIVVAALLASGLAERSWDAVGRHEPPQQYSGPAVLMTDPVRRGGAVQMVVEVRGKRFEVWGRGSPGRRLAARRALQVVWVDGRIGPPSERQARRLALRHVVGVLQVDRVGDWSSGSPLARSTERTLGLLERGARVLSEVDRSLYLGLVVGDDRAQPPALVDDFRGAGLGHLSAVSGQNVAFLLALALPVLRRLRPGWRWGATLVLLGWFATLTRFEPSVLRATFMAGIAATAFALGRVASPVRLLGLAVSVLLLVDPFLVWSVGFWLSVSATAGIVLLSPRIAQAVPGPRPVALAVAVTLSAQVGVAPIAWLVFGREAVWALPANLLAEPLAGFVMTYGLPSGLLAGLVPKPLAALLHGPTAIALFGLRGVASTFASIDWQWARVPVTVASALSVVLLVWRARVRRTDA
jgi:competence protein ComEC